MLLWDALRPDIVASVGQLPAGSLLQPESAVSGRGASWRFISTQSVGTSRCRDTAPVSLCAKKSAECLIYMDIEMKEKRKKTIQPKMRMPATVIIMAVVFTFTASITTFQFGVKAYSSTSGKKAGRSDPLGDALSGVAQGMTNIQLAGKAYYNQYCMVCHGDEGKGDGFNAFNLDPRPKDLTSVMKFVSNESFCKSVANGARSQDGKILCPPWGRTLDKDKIVAMVDYIRTLGKSQ